MLYSFNLVEAFEAMYYKELDDSTEQRYFLPGSY